MSRAQRVAEKLGVSLDGHEPANGATDPDAGLALSDFVAYLPDHTYIFRPTGKIWDRAGVNAAIPPVAAGTNEHGKPRLVPAADWLDRHAAVHDLTWMPGQPEIIEGRFLDEGGWSVKPGGRTFNLYRPPAVASGNPDSADPWLDHVRFLYPDEADHLLNWLAHRVQRPGEKLNHALVLGGAPGIGKDTIFEPVRHAIGPWNFADVSPAQFVGRFNAFLKSVILRVSELRDFGDVDRFAFYEHAKTIIAAPPDSLLVDEKYVRGYRVPNVTAVVFTTNHRTDGLYLPADDRRHFVAWSQARPEDFPPGYWDDLYRWFVNDGEGGSGNAHVAAYLMTRDLSAFDPKAPPPKTAAFWDIVAAGRAPEDAELADALDYLGWPDAVTIPRVIAAANRDLSPDQVRLGAKSEFALWLSDRRNARKIPHRFEAVGYVAVRNEATKDGFWEVEGRRTTVYAKASLSIRDRIAAARALAGGW